MTAASNGWNRGQEQQYAEPECLPDSRHSRQVNPVGDDIELHLLDAWIGRWIRYPRTLKPELWTGGARSVRARSA